MTKTPKEKGVESRLRKETYFVRGEVLDVESPTSTNLGNDCRFITK